MFAPVEEPCEVARSAGMPWSRAAVLAAPTVPETDVAMGALTFWPWLIPEITT